MPDEFLKDEVRCGHCVSQKMKAVWGVELNLLSALLAVCQKHKLRIWLAGGSLLGAMRHKGYVPWDDDLDVMMPLSDFLKLRRIAESEMPSGVYFQTQLSDPQFPCSLLDKVRMNGTAAIFLDECKGGRRKYHMGIFVDILPLVPIPEHIPFLKFRGFVIRAIDAVLRRVDNSSCEYNGSKHKILCVVARIVRCCGLVRMVSEIRDAMWCWFPFQKCSKVRMAPSVLHDAWRWTYPMSLFEETLFVPFEYCNVPVPSGWRQILDVTYGNWQRYVKGGSYHEGLILDASRDWKDVLRSVKNNGGNND